MRRAQPLLKVKAALSIKFIIAFLVIFIGLIYRPKMAFGQSKTTIETVHFSTKTNSLRVAQVQKRLADTLFSRSTNLLIVFAKISNKSRLVQVKNGHFPDNVEISFNILKDKLGQPILIKEYPMSQSGDWDISYTHYFDKNGLTIAFERQANFFNSICTKGVAYQTTTFYYDHKFRQIQKSERLKDKQGKNLKKSDCQFNYDFEYQIYPNKDKLLKIKRIEIKD